MSNPDTFDDEYWMQFAYEQAALAAEQGEIPVGAVIVRHYLAELHKYELPNQY